MSIDLQADSPPLQVVKRGNTLAVRLRPCDRLLRAPRHRLQLRKLIKQSVLALVLWNVAILGGYYFVSLYAKPPSSEWGISMWLAIGLFLLAPLAYPLVECFLLRTNSMAWEVLIERGQLSSGEPYTAVHADTYDHPKSCRVQNPRFIELIGTFRLDEIHDREQYWWGVDLFERYCTRIQLTAASGAGSRYIAVSTLPSSNRELAEREGTWLYDYLRRELALDPTDGQGLQAQVRGDG